MFDQKYLDYFLIFVLFSCKIVEILKKKTYIFRHFIYFQSYFYINKELKLLSFVNGGYFIA